MASLAFGVVQGKGIWKIVPDGIGESAKSDLQPQHKSLLGTQGTEDGISVFTLQRHSHRGSGVLSLWIWGSLSPSAE